MEPSRNLGSKARKKQSFFFSVLSLFCYHFLKIEGLLFSYYIFSFLEKLITPKNTCEKKRSESKGEKERYKHLNAEFQRLARRDKKAFLSDQCKEIEENNRMGKTRDLFKKIRDTKGTFHAKMGSIKD